jgi:hypothetical protein
MIIIIFGTVIISVMGLYIALADYSSSIVEAAVIATSVIVVTIIIGVVVIGVYEKPTPAQVGAVEVKTAIDTIADTVPSSTNLNSGEEEDKIGENLLKERSERVKVESGDTAN